MTPPAADAPRVVLPDDAFAFALEASRAAREADPLKHYRCMSWAQERYIKEMYVGLLDTYWHSGNNGGKTMGGTFCDLAACRGITSVTGYYRECARCHADNDPREHPVKCGKCGGALRDKRIVLPQLKPPVSWGVGVPSYKVFAGSGLPMIRALLGTWPCVEIRQGNRNTVTQVLIRHELSKSKSEPDETWSTMFIFPYDGEMPEGVRLDGYRCDEPPPAHFLDALRTRKKAGKPMRAGITATPMERTVWEPILSQYPAELLKPEGRRFRIQSSVYDNAALTAADIREIEQNLKGRPKSVVRARLMGDHEDFSGDCPFDLATLDAWEKACEEPRRVRVQVQREVDSDGARRIMMVPVMLEFWEPHDPQDFYLVVGDPGKGIRDGKHDPDCAHVWSRRKRKLVARMNDHIGGYALGHIMAIFGQRYGNAPVHPAVTGGYGESVLNGLRSAGYHYIGRERREVKPGQWSSRLGFWESLTSNNEWKEAVEDAIASRSVTIPSLDVVRCLKNLVVDENGKVLGGGGHHDEDWVCAGRAIYLLADRAMRPADPPAPVGTLEWLHQQAQKARRAPAFGGVPERW